MNLMSTMTMSATSSCCVSDLKMTTMELKLVLCFLLGLFSVSSAEREYQVRLIDKGSTNYPHAGRPEVYINGAWATICASDWDMNDAEVVCRDLGLGYPNSLTVSGGLPAESTGVSSVCLSTVKCYGHEEHLSECVTLPDTRSGHRNDKGIVCFPPPSDPGLQLTYGPDQYSGYVEVKLASGSWSKLYGYGSHSYYWDWSDSQYISNICRQLGLGELNWWDVAVYSSSLSMTYVRSCAYGVAHHASCTFSSTSRNYQAFVGCHKPGSIKCGAPYIPHHAMVENLRLNYDFGERVTVTCNTSDASFLLQCHNKGLWSGPLASCPEPKSAPSVDSCSAPAVPIDSTIQNLRLSYKNGDRMNVTCNVGSDWFDVTCEDGTWTGQNIVCPDPAIECNQPIISGDAYIRNVKPRYKNGDEVNITCNDDSDSFIWFCHRDGLWRGPTFECSRTHPPSEGPQPPSPDRFTRPNIDHDGRDYFITGLLVTAVILFILVLMCMAVFVIFMRNRGYDLVTSSKDTLQDENGSRGPLPDVPEGYANYVAGEQSLYVEPYLKQNGDHIPAYEVYEKPV